MDLDLIILLAFRMTKKHSSDLNQPDGQHCHVARGVHMANFAIQISCVKYGGSATSKDMDPKPKQTHIFMS